MKQSFNHTILLDYLPARPRVSKLDAFIRDELLNYMTHSLNQAGCPQLMTNGLMQTLVNHCAGNQRVLYNMAAELLAMGLKKNVPH